MKSIRTEELKVIFDRIITKLESEGISQICISDDLYRIVPTDSWNDFSNNEIIVGSLEDDIDELKKIILDQERYCTYVDFDRTASLLRAISQEVNPV